MSTQENVHSFRPPLQSSSRSSSARCVLQTSPPKRFVFAQMSVGLKEFYERLSNKWKYKEYSAFENENADEEIFSPSLCTLLADRYKISGIIGKGQSAILVKAEDTFHPHKRQVAIKILHASYSNLGPQEASCLLHIKKADTLKVAKTIEILNMFIVGPHFCMVFELLRPRPLHEYFQMWPFKSKADKIKLIRKIAFQITQSLAVLSSLNIIHADIKPENILFQNGDESKIKIIDFGNALYCIHDEISLYFEDFDLQTIIYRAPEVMFGLPFGPQIDIWSLACVLVEFFIGEPLFLGRSKEEILEKFVAYYCISSVAATEARGNVLLKTMQTLLGPLPMNPFQTGKYFPNLKRFVGPISSVPAHCKVVINIMKKLATTDYAFADFIARLLTYDPSKRLDAFEAARHPFLASECALGYFLPPEYLTHNIDKECSYSPLILTTSTYLYRPKIDERVKNLHYSGLDLLRVGTNGIVTVELKLNLNSAEPEAKNTVNIAGELSNLSESSVTMSQHNVVERANEETSVRPSITDTLINEVPSGDSSVSETGDSITSASSQGNRKRRRKASRIKKTFESPSSTGVSFIPGLFPRGNGRTSRKMDDEGISQTIRNFLDISNTDVSTEKHLFQPEKKSKLPSSTTKTIKVNNHLKKSRSPNVVGLKTGRPPKNLRLTFLERNVKDKKLGDGATVEENVRQSDPTSGVSIFCVAKSNTKNKDDNCTKVMKCSSQLGLSCDVENSGNFDVEKSSEFSEITDYGNGGIDDYCDDVSTKIDCCGKLFIQLR